jgi:hypothetical protein
MAKAVPDAIIRDKEAGNSSRICINQTAVGDVAENF